MKTLEKMDAPQQQTEEATPSFRRRIEKKMEESAVVFVSLTLATGFGAGIAFVKALPPGVSFLGIRITASEPKREEDKNLKEKLDQSEARLLAAGAAHARQIDEKRRLDARVIGLESSLKNASAFSSRMASENARLTNDLAWLQARLKPFEAPLVWSHWECRPLNTAVVFRFVLLPVRKLIVYTTAGPLLPQKGNYWNLEGDKIGIYWTDINGVSLKIEGYLQNNGSRIEGSWYPSVGQGANVRARRIPE